MDNFSSNQMPIYIDFQLGLQTPILQSLFSFFASTFYASRILTDV